MGIYLNPGNNLFRQAVNSKIYVDKSMLIDITNKNLDTTEKHICISRPRRFGKSMAANMLTAYYSRGCDSRELFRNLKISETEDFEKYLNKYNVIRFDVSKVVSKCENCRQCVALIDKKIRNELIQTYPYTDSIEDLEDIFATIYNNENIPFVFIIDEWDCMFRFFKDDTEGQKKYLDFLRDILKEQDYVALNYATGIFPVKKYGKHSAMNMYNEYSMAEQAAFAEFTGFTEAETTALCEQYDLSVEEMKSWYDGYKVGNYDIFNPKSVVQSIETKRFSNYWTKTETFEALRVFIQLDMNGLRNSVIKMIADSHIPVNTDKFQNDMVSMKTADDVLTLLIHLGYLTYDFNTKTCWIPNKEVRQEFINCIEDGGWEEVMNSIKLSDEMLSATLSGDKHRVEEIIESVHQANTSILKYNDENSLACVVSLAYYSARNKYEIFRELPGGKGFADLTFIPRNGVDAPAIVVELKYNKTAEAAIDQIKKKNYTEKLSAFSGDILLVGISYDNNKGHSCVIERITKQ